MPDGDEFGIWRSQPFGADPEVGKKAAEDHAEEIE